jgi:predicted transposase/invertase (TIGR01784 family)
MLKRLDPKLDVVFKILFAAPENRELLISLLTAVLRPSSPIVSVEVLNPQMPKELVTDKGAVLDLHVKLADGREVDVEMQAGQRPGLRSRALYYWARMYGAQLGPGMAYEELRPCVVVFILGYSELQSGRFHSTFGVQEVHGGERFSDQLEVHLVELPKLPKRGAGQSEEELLEDWGRFFSARGDEELEELAMSNPVIEKAKMALDFLSAQPDVQELARQRERQRELAQINWLTSARAAEAKGRAEGEAKGRAHALVALLRARGLDVPPVLQERILACEDLAVLDGWIARAATASSIDEVVA